MIVAGSTMKTEEQAVLRAFAAHQDAGARRAADPGAAPSGAVRRG